MTIRRWIQAAVALFSALAFSPEADSRVTRIEVKDVVSPVFGGRVFGDVGAYERVSGVMTIEVDPDHPLNFGIVNIQRAPRNASGLVAFDVDFSILKPIDMGKAGDVVLYDLVNRGNPLVLSMFNDAAGRDPTKADAAGNGFLMERGYVVISSGWQAPYPVAGAPFMGVGMVSRINPGRGMTARLPVARNLDGSVLTGPHTEGFVDTGDGERFTQFLTYAAARLEENGRLRVKERHADAWTELDRGSFRFLDEWRVEIVRPKSGGFDSGAIYEFTYEAKDPLVYGLAYAAIRDVVSFFKNNAKDDAGAANPLASSGAPPKALFLGFGASQTGRTLKSLLYEFNEDEAGRKLFDGVHIHISGGSMNSPNFAAFATPGQKSGQHGIAQPGDQFPFTYGALYDPLSRRTDGLLARCRGANNCPKVIHTDSENEVWHGGWLVYTDTAGKEVAIPDNVRVYLFTGTQHGPGGGPPGMNMCKYPDNPLDYRPLMRALLVALERWAANGTPPPNSRYPRVADGTLLSLEEARAGFPTIPGVADFGVPFPVRVTDYSLSPPSEGARYPILAAAVDGDGNTRAGIRLPEIAAPLGTRTGWNIRAAGHGEGDLCMASGSLFPFATTKDERLASGDSRLSIEERYPRREAYVKAVSRSAKALAKQGFLLPQDVETAVETARKAELFKK